MILMLNHPLFYRLLVCRLCVALEKDFSQKSKNTVYRLHQEKRSLFMAKIAFLHNHFFFFHHLSKFTFILETMGKFAGRKPQKAKPAPKKKKEPETFEECMEGEHQ